MTHVPDVPPPSALEAPQDILAQRDTQPLGWGLYDTASAQAIEHAAAQGLPAHTLMRRAGEVIARLALAVQPHARRIVVLVGPGNNGGDGLEAARHLLGAGRKVSCHLVLPDGADAQRHRWPVDAAAALARAVDAQVPVRSALPDSRDAPPDLVIDALLGRGLRRAVAGRLAEAIAWLHEQAAAGCHVLAVDLPSGLLADSGAVPPDAPCVRADTTLSLLTVAPGLFTARGREQAGDIWWHDLGVTPQLADTPPCAWLVSRPWLARHWPRRTHAQHKGSFGDVWVLGGAPGMSGAALLASRAALASGAGRVYLASLALAQEGSAPAGADPSFPEVMTGDSRQLDREPARWRMATMVAGCGGGSAIAAHLSGLLMHAERLVLDADALNAMAADAVLLQALRARQDQGLGTILTPHPLEAARLLGCSAAEVQADRIGAARRLAARTGAVIVLKGSGTLVSGPPAPNTSDEAREAIADTAAHLAWRTDPWVLPVGSAALGTAGSGDVLAGLIGGLWGQLAAADLSLSAMDAARLAAAAAVHLHGTTAEALSPDASALPASQLAAALRGRTPFTPI